MRREFQQVGVVGLGTMGAGIAEVFARNGLAVVAVERDEAALAAGREHVERSTGRAVARGRLTAADQQALLDRIAFGTDVAAMAECDLVVEAVPERLDLKRQVIARLDEVCKPATVLATNTSSLSVTEIAVATARPGSVIGMHFFNPAPVMKLVEVVRSVVTEPDVAADVAALARRLGKIPVTVGDRAGFVANALLFGYLNRAAAMYSSGHASREDIDAAMKLGCRLPMGPLTLLDLIGLDTACEILDTMYRQSRDRLHAAAPILRQLVTAGLLGRKTGRGFYTYDGPGSATVVADAQTPHPEAAVDGAREVHRVGVVGSGPEAAGIADAFRRAEFDVLTADAGDGAVPDRAGLAPLADRQLVVEAAAGERDATRALLAELDTICAPGTVLATTTTRLPVIECAAATSRPADVVGLHPVEPATVGVVEVVSTVATAPGVAATAVAAVRRLGAHPVRCADRAGFVVDALLFPYLNDAVRMLAAGYASADDIDAAMTLGCGYPAGPFATLDDVGLDVALRVQRALYRESREPGLAPAPLLEQLVTVGRLGHKTGRGFRPHG